MFVINIKPEPCDYQESTLTKHNLSSSPVSQDAVEEDHAQTIQMLLNDTERFFDCKKYFSQVS
jgi:hypothetical protein